MLLWFHCGGGASADFCAKDLYPLVIVVKCYLHISIILVAGWD